MHHLQQNNIISFDLVHPDDLEGVAPLQGSALAVVLEGAHTSGFVVVVHMDSVVDTGLGTALDRRRIVASAPCRLAPDHHIDQRPGH